MKHEYAQLKILDHLREFADKPEWRTQSAIMRETGVRRGQFETVMKCLLALPSPVVVRVRIGKYVVFSLSM